MLLPSPLRSVVSGTSPSRGMGPHSHTVFWGHLAMPSRIPWWDLGSLHGARQNLLAVRSFGGSPCGMMWGSREQRPLPTQRELRRLPLTSGRSSAMGALSSSPEGSSRLMDLMTPRRLIRGRVPGSSRGASSSSSGPATSTSPPLPDSGRRGGHSVETSGSRGCSREPTLTFCSQT